MCTVGLIPAQPLEVHRELEPVTQSGPVAEASTVCPTVEAMRAQVSTRYPVANAASVGTSSPPEAARTATIASNAERNRLRALGVLIKFPRPPGRAPHDNMGRPKVWDAQSGQWLVEGAVDASGDGGSEASAIFRFPAAAPTNAYVCKHLQPISHRPPPQLWFLFPHVPSELPHTYPRPHPDPGSHPVAMVAEWWAPS